MVRPVHIGSITMATQILKVSLYSAAVVALGAPLGAAIWVGLALLGF